MEKNISAVCVWGILITLFAMHPLRGQTVDFDINTEEGCAPLGGVIFTDMSSGGNVIDRTWDLGNGKIITSGEAEVGTNYLHPGTFPVTLEVTFENGETKSKTRNVLVHPKPIADFKTDDTLGCYPLGANFTDLSTTTTGSITNWQWDFGAGGSSDENPAFTFNSPGEYRISLIVENNWGCRSEAASKAGYVKVYVPPEPSFTTDKNFFCDAPGMVQFNNTTTGGGPLSYQWDFGDGSPVSTDENPVHTYDAEGVYRVRLTAFVGECSKSVTTTVNTDIYVGTPDPAIDAPDVVCTNNPISFKGSGEPSGLAYAYSWHFEDDNSTRSGANITHAFSSPGDYTVTLTTSTRFGCSKSIRKKIHVNPAPDIDFTADQNIFCSLPAAVQFSSSADRGGLSYVWNFGDGNTSSSPNPAHTYSRTGNYRVTLTVKDTANAIDACEMTVVKNNFIQVQIPTIDFELFSSGSCAPYPIETEAKIRNLLSPLDSLIWEWGDGTSDTVTDGSLRAAHTYLTDGTFSSRVTLITSDGCRQTSDPQISEVSGICDDDGSGFGGGGGGGAGFQIGKECEDKYRVSFQDTVSNTTVLEWDFGDGTLLNSGSLNPVYHQFAPPQKEYIVEVKRKDNLTGEITSGKKNIIIIDEKADFEPDITDICKHTEVHFNTLGMDSSNIKSYTWDFGDGSPKQIIQNQNNFETAGIWLNGNTGHVYQQNGIFDVKLIIEDRLGCLDSLTYPIPIKVAGPEAGFFTADPNSCSPLQEVIFENTSTQNGATPILTWEWNFGDGSTLVTDQDTNVVHTYTNNSYYNFRTVSLKITDDAGCTSEAKEINYIKGYQPKADFTSSDQIHCDIYDIRFTNRSQAYGAQYLWDFGDGQADNSTHPRHTYATNGEYDIQLIVRDENGCRDTAAKNSFIQIIQPEADFSIRDTNLCAPVGVTFKDSSQYALSWEWDFGDGGTGSTDQNPSPHIYDKPGFYDVTLKVTGIDGCVAQKTKRIRVKGPIASWDAKPVIDCAPVTLDATITGSFIDTYAWDFGDGTSVNTSNSQAHGTHTYKKAGKYLPNVVLTSPEGCTYILEVEDSIIVDTLKVDFTPKERIFCDSGFVQFEDLSKVPSFSSIVSYAWDFGDGSVTENTATPANHRYNKVGDYDVRLMTESQYGCRKELTIPKAVIVNESPDGEIEGEDIQCAPGTYFYSFSKTTSDEIKEYQWTVNGLKVGENSPELAYDFRAGTYIIGLDLISEADCASYLEKEIRIDSLIPQFTIPNPDRCEGDNVVDFQNSSYGFYGIEKWEWDFGDNQANQEADPVHTFLQPGAYKVKLTTTSETGCTATISEALAIYPTPQVGIDGVFENCAQAELSFRPEINSVDPVTDLHWKMDGMEITDDSTFTHYFQDSGAYELELSVHTLHGCTHSFSDILTIHPLPVPRAYSDTTICEGETIQLHAEDGVSYLWSPADYVSDVDAARPDVTPARETNFKVKVTNQYGCEQWDSTLVSTDERVNLFYPDAQFLCKGDQVQLEVSGNTNEFRWSPALGLEQTTGDRVIASPATSITYTVKGISQNVCPSETGDIHLEVKDYPSLELDSFIQVTAGTPVTLSPSASADVIDYAWTPSTGLNCPTCEEVRFTADKNITYSLKVENQYGCQVSSQVRVEVLCNEDAVYIPTAFTPNNDGMNDVFYIMGHGITRINSLLIFDRWGNRVFQNKNFQANDRSQGWDGLVNGREVGTTTTFVYMANVECSDGKNIPLKGHVVLVR